MLATTMQVPAKWRDFLIIQHAVGSPDGALACVAAAAVHLGLIDRGDDPVADLLSKIPRSRKWRRLLPA